MRMITRSKFLLTFLTLSMAFALGACQPNRGYDTGRLKDFGRGNTGAQTTQNAGNTAQTTVSAPQATTNAPQRTQTNNRKVALLLPLSGQHAKLGTAMLNAAQLALFDIGTPNVDLVPYDTNGTPAGAASAARAVIADGAEIILGPLFAGSVRAVKPIASNARVNVVAFSTDWSLAGGNTFVMGFLPFDQVDRIISYAAGNGINTVGLLMENTDYGRTVSSVYRRIAAQNRINTARSVSLPVGGQNLTENIRSFSQAINNDNQAPKAPFQAAFMAVGGNVAINTSNIMTRFGATPSAVKRLGTGLFDDPSLLNDATLNGAWFAAPDPSGRATFENNYRTTFGATPPRLSTLAYDATALAAVLSARGGFAKSALMNPNGFTGIDGIFRFRDNGLAERGLAVLEISNGRLTVRDPAPKTFQ